MAIPTWQTGSALEFDIDAGADDTINVGALVSGETAIEEVFGVALQSWMSWNPATKVLTLTNAPTLREDTEFVSGFRAENDDGTRAAKLTITLNGSVLASLHNTLFFKECVNYETGRVEIRSSSTKVTEMTNDDHNTYSEEDDIDIDMRDANNDATAIDYVFIKYTGTLTSYIFTPTGGSGSSFTRTVPTTTKNIRGSDVDLEVNGWKHDLFPLAAQRTATSVRMQFTGTNLKIHALALLEKGIEIDANASYTDIGFDLVDRVGRIDISPGGRGSRHPGVGGERWKWEYAFTGILDTDLATEFRAWSEQNPNCWCAPAFSLDPEQVFPALFPALVLGSQYFSVVKSNGDSVSIEVAER